MDVAAGTDETGQMFEGESDLKKIALTFDDGPHPYYTEQLLDGLKERGVVATFFVTGEHASLHPDVIKQMQEEGHLIGNHTYSHMQLTKRNREKFKEELMKTNEVIEEITGQEVIYVRPPYGTWDKKFEEELNMIPVLWTIDPLDWCS
ncbi:MAG: polysaccharide deacetylase family protein, partial [Acetatifactor sp.]|nr:polysaccharide deacetylase family protein [Acetatifactor sp.]